MRILKTSTFLLLLAIAASAQVDGVTVTGTVDMVIHNNSGKPIVAAAIAQKRADGVTQRIHQLFTNKPDLLMNGASEQIGRYTRNQTTPIASVSIEAVVDSDGNLSGNDVYFFGDHVEKELQAIKDSYASSKSGDWAKVEALSGDSNESILGRVAAMRFLKSRDVSPYAYYEKLPSHVIRPTSPIAKLMNWVIPTVHAQTHTGPNPSTLYPYQQGWGTNYWHYTPWQYSCNSPLFGSSLNPCPARLSDTDEEGNRGRCTDHGGYFVAIQAIATIEDNLPYITVGIGAQQSATSWTLFNSGQCTDLLYGTIESWSYTADCTGPPVAPTKITDTTSGICGSNVAGYF